MAGYNFLGASGHTTIYAADINIMDRNNILHVPDGCWGTIGAGGNIGGVYRSSAWLDDDRTYKPEDAHFTRFSPP